MNKEVAPAINPLKGIDIEDKNLKVVYLKSGKYLVDGEVITVESYSEAKVQVKDVSNIRIITENKYIKEYVCGEEKLSVKQYDEQINQLLSKESMTVTKKSGKVLMMNLHIENLCNCGHQFITPSKK